MLFKRSNITHFERKNSRPDIATLAGYEITPTAILKTRDVSMKQNTKKCIFALSLIKVNA